MGIQLFDKEGTRLLQTGWDFKKQLSSETVLRDDERILGFKARSYSDTQAAYYDFQFVIGRIE